MKKLLTLLFLAFPLAAQTPVGVLNANFQAPVTFTNSDAAGDQWAPNVAPNWTIGPGPGVVGTFAGIQSLVSACGTPTQMLYSNDPTVTQDLGPAQAGTYSFSVSVCNRSDGAGSAATYTLSLLDGTAALCSEVGLNSSNPSGAFTTLTQSCVDAAPAADLIVSLACSGSQCNFGSVSVTFTAIVPPVTLTFGPSTSSLMPCTDVVSYDDGTPLFSGPQTFTIMEQEGSAQVSIGTPTIGINGQVTGSVTVNPNYAANGQVLLFATIGGVAGLPQIQAQPFDPRQLQQGSTGICLGIVLFKSITLPKYSVLGLTP
jgi:hypothetical protein